MSDNPATPATDFSASISGGTGTVSAWKRPDLVLAAPSGVGLFTPASMVIAARATVSIAGGQDISQCASGNHATVAQEGLVMFTLGKATDAAKPNQETGIKLHAASGSVHVQAHSGAVELTAGEAVDLTSTKGMVRVDSPLRVLLTAAGAALDIQSGGITIRAPGAVRFKAAMKRFEGPGTASREAPNLQTAAMKGCVQSAQQAASLQAATVDVD